jgi:hypothetical protein
MTLPIYCIDTNKIPPIEKIAGIDKAILKENDITEAWRIIGEQSEFMIKLVCAHEDNVGIPIEQFIQFMHFFMNMLGRGFRSLIFIDIPITEGFSNETIARYPRNMPF